MGKAEEGEMWSWQGVDYIIISTSGPGKGA